MKKLSYRDTGILQSAITDLHADTSQTTLTQRTTDSVTKLIPNELVSFDGYSSEKKYSFTAWNNRADLLTAEVLEMFARFAYQHPLIPIALERNPQKVVKMTDYISQSDFEKTDLYNEFFRRIGHKYQMGMSLPVTPDLIISCGTNRSKKDFSERDKLMLSLLAPHLLNAVRHAFDFERLNSALESKECGVIAVNKDGKSSFVSEFSRLLLEKYFSGEKTEDNSLPQSLWSWIKQNSFIKNEIPAPAVPLKIQSANGELSIRMIYNRTTRERTLLLEEKKYLTPEMLKQLNLTKREAEILFWMSQGKTDSEIASLCSISIYTVHKHAQNIYVKLGVETRTAAVIKALETHLPLI